MEDESYVTVHRGTASVPAVGPFSPASSLAEVSVERRFVNVELVVSGAMDDDALRLQLERPYSVEPGAPLRLTYRDGPRRQLNRQRSNFAPLNPQSLPGGPRDHPSRFSDPTPKITLSTCGVSPVGANPVQSDCGRCLARHPHSLRAT